LANFGCSEAQGWLFGRAISGDAVRAFLSLGSGNDQSAVEAPSEVSAENKRKANKRW